MSPGGTRTRSTIATNTLANFDHRSFLSVTTRFRMDGIVLWKDESAFLRRMTKGWGVLALSGCADEQAVAAYVCSRGFATQAGSSVRLSGCPAPGGG